MHRGYILYDANKEIAIPLCKGALDHWCSNKEVKTEFVGFAHGWIFEYRGKAQERMIMIDQPELQQMKLHEQDWCGDGPKTHILYDTRSRSYQPKNGMMTTPTV